MTDTDRLVQAAIDAEYDYYCWPRTVTFAGRDRARRISIAAVLREAARQQLMPMDLEAIADHLEEATRG